MSKVTLITKKTEVITLKTGPRGPQGIKGDKGNQWRGAYSGATAYVVDDVVSYLGSSYICILASTNNLPTDITFWSLFAATGTANASNVTNTPTGNISATNVQNAINELDTEKANRVQEAWITPTLLNGYTSVAGQTVRYRKTEFGEVVMQGRATGGTQGAPILILPVGYRPTIPTFIPASSGANFALLWVEVNGAVSVLGAGNTNIALYSIRFFID